MDKNFATRFFARFILIFGAAALTTLFYNNTIAWNFNLPAIGFWEFMLGFWAARFFIVAICNSLNSDNDR